MDRRLQSYTSDIEYTIQVAKNSMKRDVSMDGAKNTMNGCPEDPQEYPKPNLSDVIGSYLLFTLLKSNLLTIRTT